MTASPLPPGHTRAPASDPTAALRRVRKVLGNVDDDTDGGSAEDDYSIGMDDVAARIRRALDGDQ